MSRRKLNKILWYSSGLSFSGGGERLLLEGLEWFSREGMDAHLFTRGKPIDENALFNGRYHPKVLTPVSVKKDGASSDNTSESIVKTLFKLRTELKSMYDFDPDAIVANDPGHALHLWISEKLLGRKSIPYVCFIHGSPFQFAGDLQKYMLIFRRAFHTILNSDEVYREVIPKIAPKMGILKRLKMELYALLKYFAVRNAKVVFVLTENNKLEL